MYIYLYLYLNINIHIFTHVYKTLFCGHAEDAVWCKYNDIL